MCGSFYMYHCYEILKNLKICTFTKNNLPCGMAKYAPLRVRLQVSIHVRTIKFHQISGNCAVTDCTMIINLMGCNHAQLGIISKMAVL
jgi:hypothetical protein